MFSQEQIRRFYTIAGGLSNHPFITYQVLDADTGLARSTISRYVIRMRKEDMLFGPWLSVKPHENYKEYVYLMQYSDPTRIFEGLKNFPNVLYHAITFGDWNILIMADRPLDFRILTGYEAMISWGVKGNVDTPQVVDKTWGRTWREVRERIITNTLSQSWPNGKMQVLDWGEDEWKLYHALKRNVRKKIIPLLRKIDVRYETFHAWKKTLLDHCSIHTEFYLGGIESYINYCLLLSTEDYQSVKELFSLFPTTPILMEMGDQLLVFVKVTSEMTREMICMIYEMINQGILKKGKYAAIMDEWRS